MAIVTIDDYIGEFQLQIDNQTTARFNAIRDNHTNDYIYQLLGAELGALYIADLDANGVPSEARFLALYNAFQEDLSNGFYFWDSYYSGMVQSKGMKFFIKGIIWWYFARANNVRISLAGNKSSVSQNSSPNADGLFLARIYNEAIETGKAIQWYIYQNSSTYPEYNGQRLEYNIGI